MYKKYLIVMLILVLCSFLNNLSYARTSTKEETRQDKAEVLTRHLVELKYLSYGCRKFIGEKQHNTNEIFVKTIMKKYMQDDYYNIFAEIMHNDSEIHRKNQQIDALLESQGYDKDTALLCAENLQIKRDTIINLGYDLGIIAKPD